MNNKDKFWYSEGVYYRESDGETLGCGHADKCQTEVIDGCNMCPTFKRWINHE